MLLEQGHDLDREGVGRSIEMLKSDQSPTDGARTTEVVRGRKSVRPKTAGQKRYVDAVASAHHHVRHRARRNRQELPRGRARGAGAAGQGGEPHHPHPPRRRSG